MLNIQPVHPIKFLGLSALLICLIPVTVGATSTTIRLSANSDQRPKVVRGFVRAAVGLHNIVGERDQRKKRCMGYGSISPDYQLEVKQNLPKLSLQVRSKAKDTTLVVRGPNNTLLCADDSALGKDAGLTLNNLKPGLYQVWVGAFDSGGRFSYTLSIQ